MMEDIKKLIVKAGVTMAVVLVLMTGYGLFWVWYQTTGYVEQNQVALKPQRWPGYVQTANNSVPKNQSEITVTTRDVAKTLKNPVPRTNENINAGKESYDIYCAICHGENGEGRGLMGSVTNLAPVAKDENVELQDYLREFIGTPVNIDLGYVGDTLVDGEIYYTITQGGESIMPSFRDALSPKQRWQLVSYIRWRFLNNFGK